MKYKRSQFLYCVNTNPQYLISLLDVNTRHINDIANIVRSLLKHWLINYVLNFELHIIVANHDTCMMRFSATRQDIRIPKKAPES